MRRVIKTGCISVWMYLKSLNYTHKRGLDGQFCYIFLPQFLSLANPNTDKMWYTIQKIWKVIKHWYMPQHGKTL